MKSWKMALSLVLCVVMAVSLLAACNNTPQTSPTPNGGDTPSVAPSPTPPVDNKEEQITLRFSWWGPDARHEATLAVIAAFERDNPNIKIEPEYGAQDGYNDKKTTEFSTKTAPDMFQIETGMGVEYYRQGVLANLSELSSISFDKFDPAFLESNGQFGSGSQWCIPAGAAGSALIVNKTLADQIGIDLSQQMDFEGLIALGEQVQAYDPSIYLLSANIGTGVPFFIRAYSRQLNGVPMIDDASKKLNMTEEQFTQMFDLIDRLYKTKTCAPASMKAPYDNNDQEDPNWIGGKYVAAIGFTSSAQVLSEAVPGAEFIAGALPLLADRKSDGWTNNCPQYMGISADTPYPEECAKFLDFFFNSEEAAEILGTVRSVPPTAMAQQIVTEKNLGNPLVVQAVGVSLSYAGFDDAGYTTNENVTQILEDAYEAVSYGTLAPAAAAKDVVEKINAYLATQ